MKKLVLSVGVVLISGLMGCGTGELEEEFTQAEEAIAEMEQALEQATVRRPALIHSVFFWLKEGVSEEEKAAFVEGCEKLGEIESVQAVYVGPPAATPDRDVVDHSFDTALIVHFGDMEAHDLYQEAPLHQEFIDKYEDLWERVQVYDNAVK